MPAMELMETKGLVGLVAADRRHAQSRDVRLVKADRIGGGLVTAIVSGDVGSVRAAIEVKPPRWLVN